MSTYQLALCGMAQGVGAVRVALPHLLTTGASVNPADLYSCLCYGLKQADALVALNFHGIAHLLPPPVVTRRTSWGGLVSLRRGIVKPPNTSHSTRYLRAVRNALSHALVAACTAALDRSSGARKQGTLRGRSCTSAVLVYDVASPASFRAASRRDVTIFSPSAWPSLPCCRRSSTWCGASSHTACAALRSLRCWASQESRTSLAASPQGEPMPTAQASRIAITSLLRLGAAGEE